MKKLAKKLIKHNTYQYNLLKASEELMELALVLQQRVLKPTRIEDQAIIDEIGDVKIRMEVLEKLFDKQAINERVEFKTTKFTDYIDNQKYQDV